MSLDSTLKAINDNFFATYLNPAFHSSRNARFKNTSMEISFMYNSHNSMIMNWFVPQDKYSMIIELTNDKSVTINTWDLYNNTNTWNEDFIIDFDVERSYFDCLNMVYPMNTNFKYKHLAILKGIAEQYLKAKEIHKYGR